MEHVFDVIQKGNVSAVMVSSLFHYHYLKDNESSASDLEGNVEFLNQKRNFHTFELCNINNVKTSLISNQIQCRL